MSVTGAVLASAHSQGACWQLELTLQCSIPAGVNKQSVDTWLCPGNFRMDCSTGAPPDYYATEGQNWGFPTYNWEEMAKDGFQWWRLRLQHMAQCVGRINNHDNAVCVGCT